MKNIDAINKQVKPVKPVSKPANFKKTTSTYNHRGVSKKNQNYIKLWFFTGLSVIVVIIIWLFSLRTSWQKINQQSQLESNNNQINIEDIRQNLDNVINQTVQFLDDFSLATTTIPTSTQTTKPATLTPEQIKKLTDKIIKNQELNTTTPE